MSSSLRKILFGVALLAAASQASAGDWQHEIAPYVWGSAMDGTVGIGDVTAESSLSFSDILDNLEFGFMGTYRASKDRYSFTFDALYMGRRDAERTQRIAEGRHRRGPDRPGG